MKIAFIEPKPPFNAYYFLNKLPLLGNLYMARILEKAGHEVRAFKETLTDAYNKENDRLHPFIREADFVGITSVTQTVGRAYTIADAVKRQFPAKRVIMGGSHPSACPEEVLEHADQVVIGEGEPVIRDVVENVRNERIIYGSHPDMDTLPILDLDVMEGCRKKDGSFNIPFAPLMASRGCPHNCIFCSVTQMFGRTVRVRDSALVMDELRQRSREGFRKAFFYDDNFAANPEKTKELLERMIREDIPIDWASQFTIHVANDPELLHMLKRARCFSLFIGIESINPQTLKDFHKSQTVDLIERSLERIHNAGLKVHGMFMLGGDTDNEETIERTIRFAKEAGCDTAQFSVLFPIPGTQLYDNMREENRILFDQWDYYDGSHVVIEPRMIDPVRLQIGVLKAYKKFFNTSLLRWFASRLGVGMWYMKNRTFMKRLKAVSPDSAPYA
ncbi:MAG: B12-binding domain-containing radical SAM protein [Spirochaetales bacterium]|nr:B12-binding domain-containing radical SAM protein [Spirochaetales bacterium]MCF7939219.1 B12-binding domain-containing radical SAM protein [Spirochaetales bacterium]